MSQILGFACDPGGANILRALTAPIKAAGYDVSLWGKEKALDILSPECRNITEMVPILTPEAIQHFLRQQPAKLVLTGTSGDDFTERFLWSEALSLGLSSIAVLDQWVNYGLRFSPFGLGQLELYQSSPQWPYLPDRICVMDQRAREEMIEEGLPSERIVVTGQPHLEAAGESLKTLDREAIRAELGLGPDELFFLFISEPFEQTYGGPKALGFTEKTIFAELLDALQKLEHQSERRITLAIKPHPRENPRSFELQAQNSPLQRIKLRLAVDRGPSELLVASDLVIGMASMMLIEASLIKKPILCLQLGGHGKNPLILCRSGLLDPVQTRGQLDQCLSRILDGKLPPGTPFAPTEPAASAILKVVQECFTRS